MRSTLPVDVMVPRVARLSQEIDSLMQNRRNNNSIANALELRLFCISPLQTINNQVVMA